MPNRVDRRLGDAYLAAVEEHLPVGAQSALGEKRTKLRRGKSRRGDCDRRANVNAGADMFGKDLTDKMTPRVDRHNFGRLGPLRLRHDPPRRSCVSQIGAVVTRQRPGCNCKRAIDRISAGIGTDRITLLRICGTRDHGSPVGRGRGAPMERDRTSAGVSRMGSEPDVPRYRVLHAAFRSGKT